METEFPTYLNKKGKRINLTITRHAIQKFITRRSIAFPNVNLPNSEIVRTIIKWFSSANKVKNLSRKDKARIKKYGNDTMFFRTNAFTFVVQNAAIVTIELSDKNKRHLNY